jgi:hypothetical protein
LEVHEKMDQLEAAMLSMPTRLVDVEIINRFTDRMYIREMVMRPGTVVTSKLHKTEHPFVLLSGRVSVVDEQGRVTHLTAPYVGTTKPGTRRVIYAHTDVRWATFHVNEDNCHDLDILEDRIIERRELLPGRTSNELYRAVLSGTTVKELA